MMVPIYINSRDDKCVNYKVFHYKTKQVSLLLFSYYLARFEI